MACRAGGAIESIEQVVFTSLPCRAFAISSTTRVLSLTSALPLPQRIPPDTPDAMQSRPVEVSAPAATKLRCVSASMIWVLLLFVPHSAAGAGVKSERPDVSRAAGRTPTWIQGIVDNFRVQLGLPHPVQVAVVPENTLMVSVESIDGLGHEFRLSLQENFIDELSEDELKAAIAHELGHVWIFTHHPYLQTEALANQIARRLVTHESLVRVYEKVWKLQGTKGDLVRFIGD